MNTEPLVSVLMTAFNREKYIKQAIESVLASSYQNFELIIVDDCSNDNTVSIAQRYMHNDKRIKVYLNEKNLGDYCNRNHAASYANGKYIKYLDSDDELYPEGLAYCVAQMERFGNADWASLYANEIEQEYIMDSKEAIRHHFFETPFLKIGPGGTIIKREFFIRIGMYPTSYGPANDMYFNLKAASMGKTLLLNNRFLFYRLHEGQEMNNLYSYMYNNYRYLSDALTELQLPLNKPEKRWVSLKLKRRFAVNLVRYYVKSKDFRSTRQAIRHADFSVYDFIQGLFHFAVKPR